MVWFQILYIIVDIFCEMEILFTMLSQCSIIVRPTLFIHITVIIVCFLFFPPATTFKNNVSSVMPDYLQNIDTTNVKSKISKIYTMAGERLFKSTLAIFWKSISWLGGGGHVQDLVLISPHSCFKYLHVVTLRFSHFMKILITRTVVLSLPLDVSVELHQKSLHGRN